jgi:hypothetical protein
MTMDTNVIPHHVWSTGTQAYITTLTQNASIASAITSDGPTLALHQPLHRREHARGAARRTHRGRRKPVRNVAHAPETAVGTKYAATCSGVLPRTLR